MIQEVFFLLLMALFLVGAVYNAVILYKAIIRKIAHSILFPLYPGIAGAISFHLSPYPSMHHYWWLPLLIDPGCTFSMIYAYWINIPDTYATNPFFRIARLKSHDCEGINVEITLYKSGSYTLKTDNDEPRTTLYSFGEWTRDGDTMKLIEHGKSVEYSIIRENNSVGNSVMLNWINSSAASVLDHINLKQISGKRL